MQKLVKDYLNELSKQQKKRRKIGVAVTLLVVLVIGSVVGVLMQYGVAMTGDAKCGIEEHTHTEECYTDELVCGQEEGEGHIHTDECYEMIQELICGQEESEEHAHTEECYREVQGELVCGQDESEGHTHTEDCYEEQLTCGKEEHVHTDACYIDRNADVEDASMWDAQYADTEWKGAWAEDLVTAAKAQIGYKESSDNYVGADDGSHKGYTRYGQFAEDPYADWDAAFVNFCMHYAGLEALNLFPKVTDTADWYNEFQNGGSQNSDYLAAPQGYEPKVGDIIFMVRENEERDSQMGIVSSYDKEKNEVKVIEGNSDNEVKENGYSADDAHVVAYLKMSEMEEAYKNGSDAQDEEQDAEVKEAESEKRTMTAEGSDYTVVVSFTEEAGIPEDATLNVREIEQGSEEYEKYYEQTLEEINADRLKVSRCFDISFLVDGEEIEPLAPVEVKIIADEVEVEDKEKGRVIHFAEDGTEVIDFDIDEEEKAVSFTSSSFSVYTYSVLAERSATLTTVETVDSTAKGINIRMIDYKREQTGKNQYSKFGPFTEAVGEPYVGLLSKTLSENGYPTFNDTSAKITYTDKSTNKKVTETVYPMDVEGSGGKIANTSLKRYFENTTAANHLFLQSAYDTDGYFQYDSSENAAVYNGTTGDFAVYNQLVTPVSKASNTGGNPNYKRGNFLPYNTFEQGRDSGEKDSKGNTLYLPDRTVNYHFGMEMSATFYQRRNGIDDKGNATIYEFRGDDDLWVYIDGVLVLDIGGCHGAIEGTINFATGIVTVNGVEKSLYSCYVEALGTDKADAIGWKDLSNGNKIFADYTSHSFNMWYMERGAGASNLHLKFNLPTVPTGEVQIKKELADSDKEEFDNTDYANVEFGFQVYLQPIVGEAVGGNDTFDPDASKEEYRLLCKELVDLNRTNVTAYKILSDGTTRQDIDIPSANVTETENVLNIPNNDTTRAVFRLKPGETLVLQGLKMNRKYYVREVDADSSKYDHVYVGNASIDFTDENGGTSTTGELTSEKGLNGKSYVQTIDRTVSQRAYVVFTNQCSSANDRKLEIKKVMKDGQKADKDTTFSFEVSLESQTEEEPDGGIHLDGDDLNGVLKKYTGKYYLKDGNGKWIAKDGTKAESLPKADDPERANYEYEASDGIISNVKVGYTVVIDHILSGTQFLVKETSLSSDYDSPKITDALTLEGKSSYTQAGTQNDNEASGKILLDTDAKVLVTNSYKITHEWSVIKKSSSRPAGGTEVLLEGAKFKLSAVNEADANAAGDTPTLIITETVERGTYYGLSDNQGKVVWFQDEDCSQQIEGNIPAGKYRLEEINAPAGYSRSEEVWTIEVKDNNEVNLLSPSSGVSKKEDTTDPKKDIVTFYFVNNPVYSLPETGGSGIYWYMFSGILLMAGAALLTYKKRCREVLKG